MDFKSTMRDLFAQGYSPAQVFDYWEIFSQIVRLNMIWKFNNLKWRLRSHEEIWKTNFEEFTSLPTKVRSKGLQ